MRTPQRLLFGEVAELYDASRPTYPVRLIDDLLELASVGPGSRVLEVGAGTGKATTLVAARGVGVLAIEPSSTMAAVARRNCAAYRAVQIVESDFEHWDPGDKTFPLLYCAQAWHWIDPELRFQRARAALPPSGMLAAFWNRPAWGWSPLREALRDVYSATVPHLAPDGPLHPANERPDGDEDWVGDIAATREFDQGEVHYYAWRVDYSAAAYVRLLGTLSEIRLLAQPQRDALIQAVGAVIEEHGGTLTMPMRTRLCVARAV
jgi:SAM-dependent methyltransferase